MELQILCAYLLLVNAAGFLLMYADKKKAWKNRWRIRESSLLTVAALGGSLGAWIAMYLFHHKTRHPKFYLGIPALLVLHLTLIAVYFSS